MLEYYLVELKATWTVVLKVVEMVYYSVDKKAEN
jgi:hypothetical protein